MWSEFFRSEARAMARVRLKDRARVGATDRDRAKAWAALNAYLRRCGPPNKQTANCEREETARCLKCAF